MIKTLPAYTTIRKAVQSENYKSKISFMERIQQGNVGNTIDIDNECITTKKAMLIITRWVNNHNV